jgi:formylglycine-generating enzyme required for sulfatase activity
MYSKFKLEKQSSLLKIQNHLVSVFLSFLILVLSIFMVPSTYAQTTRLLIFFDSNISFDQQFQQTLTDLLQKNVEGFKFDLLALSEEKTKQAMERYNVREEEFPIVLVLTKDEEQVEKRLPQKRNEDGDNVACEAFYQITGKLIERINPKDGAAMVYIPGGEFLMGTDQAEINEIWQKFGWKEEWKENTRDESPKHRVYVDGFWMYKYEVTVAQYRKFCNDTGHQMPDMPSWDWQDNHPIVFVNYHDAVAYCQWAGVQLPTEAQWEYAARGGNTGLNGKPRYIFVWGDEPPKGKERYGNFADEIFIIVFPGFPIFEEYNDGYVYTAPVGSFNPNGFGLYDMAGNVLEWCGDCYDENYYQNSPIRNPQGPSSGTVRVLRGGSWGDTLSDVRAVSRAGVNPGSWNTLYGFRGSSPRFPRQRQ